MGLSGGLAANGGLPASGVNASSALGQTLPLQPLPGVMTALNVMDFGAKADGVTDDTAAIQAAINALLVGGLSKGGTVYLPRTTASYLVKSAISIYSGINIVGEGPHDSSGTGGSRLIADPTGNYTNGPATTGGATGYVLKYAGAASFMHRLVLQGFGIDCMSVGGLGGIWGKGPGENSLLERLRVDNSGSTARTVSDAVTNATTTVTSATAAFTADDVNAVVTGTNVPASTKIDQVVSATQVTLNNAASGSGSGGSLTINRPADAIMLTVGAATGLARSVRGSSNAGAMLRLDNMGAGSWVVESPSADNCGGGAVRISAAAAPIDPIQITLVSPKAENSVSSGAGSSVITMDPVILLDKCDMVALNVLGGSFITGYNQRDVVRVDQPVTTRGGPSIHLLGVEGANPFNTAYTNIIRDTSTGLARAATGTPTNGQSFYPNINWNREIDASQGRITAPGINPWFVPRPITSVTDGVDNAATWSTLYDATALGTRTTQNSSNAQNDGGRWRVTLPAGTWTLMLITKTGADGAIGTVDISFDHGTNWTSIGTVDMYAASAAAQTTTFTGIAVTPADYALLRVRALTRNASDTTGWRLRLASAEWTRTA